jgi:hypothetical protein
VKDDAINAHNVVASRKPPDAVDASHQIATAAHVPPEITPEIVAVLQAAANSFAGRRVRILSIKLLSGSYSASGRWQERGRDIVQGSHNAVQHRH